MTKQIIVIKLIQIGIAIYSKKKFILDVGKILRVWLQWCSGHPGESVITECTRSNEPPPKILRFFQCFRT